VDSVIPQAVLAAIAELEGSMCNQCGVVRSVGVVVLRIMGGAGTLIVPLCRPCESRYWVEGLRGIPEVQQECIKLWAAHMPSGPVQ
jgi:hypothetical protein